MTTTSFGLSTIGQILMNVKDTDRAVAFYRDTLGMTFLFQAGTLAFFDCDGVRLMLGVPENESIVSTPILYFNVDDVETATATLKSRGVEIVSEPHVVHRTDTYDLWMAFFHDSEGNTLAMMNEKRK